MQPWPWCSFARLKEILTAPGVGCSCELIAPAGALLDVEGHPTPALYAFTRIVEGDLRFIPVHAHDDDQFIPATVIRSACAALDLDIAIFDQAH